MSNTYRVNFMVGVIVSRKPLAMLVVPFGGPLALAGRSGL
ncbi:Uncharacterised protein [Streptococcus pneumoniae]|nr:Uncharacterised protein [Streptococcus pneumoniae]